MTLIISKFTGLFAINSSRLIAIIVMTEESFILIQRFCLPYFLYEYSTEQGHLNQNYCEGDCFIEFVFKAVGV